MSKKTKNKNTALLLIGAAAFLLLTTNTRPRRPYYPQQSYIPPQPPISSGQAWAQWAATIVSLYGNVAELWQPGGPFYNVPQENVYDAINTTGNPFGIDLTTYV